MIILSPSLRMVASSASANSRGIGAAWLRPRLKKLNTLASHRNLLAYLPSIDQKPSPLHGCRADFIVAGAAFITLPSCFHRPAATPPIRRQAAAPLRRFASALMGRLRRPGVTASWRRGKLQPCAFVGQTGLWPFRSPKAHGEQKASAVRGHRASRQAEV